MESRADHFTFRNNLLSRLPAEDLSLVRPHLEWIDLPRRFVIAEPGQPISHIYFLESGICSVVARSPQGQAIEAGIIGREGATPLEVLTGADRVPHQHFVQVPGAGHRIETRFLIEAIDGNGAMRRLFLLHLQAFSIQVSFTALSNAVHSVDERLARWLLMCHDRCDNDKILLTHEFMSTMLAVRRPSVTTSLHLLEGKGFVRSERGCVIVRDRKGLEAFAADAYGKPEAEYERLLGPVLS